MIEGEGSTRESVVSSDPLEEASRDELLARLSVYERVVRELQVRQLELEVENRELHDAHHILEESRNRHADLYDFAPIACFTFDLNGCVLEVNRAGAIMIGRERAQIVGAPFVSLVALAEPAELMAHLLRCADVRAPIVTELAMTAGDPQLSMQLRVITSPVADPAGRPSAFRTALVDVTDRHQAELARDRALASERALRHELELLDQTKTVLARSLATVSEQSLSAILQIAADQARAIVDAEHAALGVGRASGTSFETWVYSGLDPQPAAALGRHPQILGTVGDVVREARTVRVKDVAATSFLGVPVCFGNRVVGTLYLTGKRGADEFCEGDQQSIESLTRYVGAVMEIARLGDQAQGAIRTRDELLATVSHDLRSPLSSISISAKLLQRILVSAEHTVARRQAEIIGRAAERMGRFIDDLLMVSTIEVGRLAVTRRPERIEQIVSEAVELAALVAAESSLEITTKIASGLPDVVCDRDRVHQVLANLVGNAMKFTPAGGRITIEAAHHDDEVRISVADTGPGIPETARPFIFERFWTGEGSTAWRGMGLGLYICKGIVDSHAGRIWVDGEEGEGTTFAFSIPVEHP